MPKLRYKESKKEEKKHHHHHHRHRRKSKSKKESYYKPPELYEEESGWVPPASSQKYDNDEEAWRAHLFDAMVDDEGQDSFYASYQQPTPKDTMTDEEYRQHIVDGMFKRTHAEEIAAEERRKAHKEKKRQEKERIRLEQEKRHAEQIRLQGVYSQLQKTHCKQDYDAKWKKLEELQVIHKKDIPWPVQAKSFSLDNVRSFVVDNTLAQSDIKKNVRKEQTRYHPDKFITRYMKRFEGSEKERERVITRINEVSGWLNEIWAQVNT